ncbi:DUF5518 domain-containing protein [Haloarchaeobius sp. HRN-SO-5]|uniref:DUF5518 domain-containing protein n=1 Tax=Haloarchaeobius sp. HRN-SO-5 TaxID=3446118 RepID=UPI003EB8E385
MEINWTAVLTGFVVSILLGIGVSLAAPFILTEQLASIWWVFLALPGLVGGFVAGYMVSGAGNGAVHGGLATVLGGIVTLAFAVLLGILFVGVVPAFAGTLVGILALFVNAIPGAIAGSLGGWAKGRRGARPEMDEMDVGTTPRAP